MVAVVDSAPPRLVKASDFADAYGRRTGGVRALWVVANRPAFHTVHHERQDLGNHARH
jgi:hypothetical protein